MSVTRWWWVRHARVVEADRRLFYGRTDVSCDVSDTKSFASLARVLPKGAVLVASPLKRTQETAAAIARAGLDLPKAQVEPDLLEQDFGAWTGRLRKEVYAALGPDDPVWRGGDARPPGGEAFSELCARVSAVIARLSEAHAGRDIVSVSHAGVIRAAIGHALSLDPGRALSFAVDHCAVTRLELIAGKDGRSHWAVAYINRRLD